MVGLSLDVVGTKHFGQFLHALSAQTVYNAASSAVLPDKFDDFFVYVFRLGTNFIVKVRTVERTLEFLGVDDAEAFLYVRPDLVGRRRSQCNDGRISDFVDDGPNPAIFWPEVVAPF